MNPMGSHKYETGGENAANTSVTRSMMGSVINLNGRNNNAGRY